LEQQVVLVEWEEHEQEKEGGYVEVIVGGGVWERKGFPARERGDEEIE
jgi:hypothetical protein